MPPQQAYGLLDFIDNIHNFIAHLACTLPYLDIRLRLNKLRRPESKVRGHRTNFKINRGRRRRW
jgi:hypothetical protein